MRSLTSIQTVTLRLATILLLFGFVLPPNAITQVSFFIPPTYTGGYGVGVTYVADFNGDGKIDIFSVETLNLGKGDGTFTALAPVPGGAQAIGDFNGDGKLDLLQVGAVVHPPKLD